VERPLRGAAPALLAALLCASGTAAAEGASLRVLAVGRDVGPSAFDDPAFADAPVAGALTQQEPSEGAPATLRTECRVLATPRALLFLFTMEEPASELVARELRRDAVLDADDRIGLVLDTYRDRRNAYFFSTNPNGVRVDGLVSGEGEPSLDWDTVWDVRVRRTADGWQALFTIPFAALTFPGDPEGIWGFNFARESKRRTETDYWTAWKRPYTLWRISQAGELAGLPVLRARTLRELTPYAAAAADRRGDPPHTALLGKAGLDFRYGVSSSVEADLTVNTDFAETEADQQQFNFGRASLFYPEKRAFFLQRAQVFDFGTRYTTYPFFSRTIGLRSQDDTSVPVPIDAGLKLTGRLGKTDFGALALQTRAAEGDPRSDFYVVRAKQDLGHASYVGALFTRLDRARDDPGHPSSGTYGADTGLRFTPELFFAAYWVKTDTPGLRGHDSAWNLDLQWESDFVKGELQRSRIGSNFSPQMGFVNEAGILLDYFDLELRPRPHVLGLRELDFETFYTTKHNEAGFLHEREYQYTFRANWLSGAYTDDDIVDVLDESLEVPLELTKSVTIPVGRYQFTRHQVTLGTDPSRAVAFQANANFGGYFGGTRNTFTGRLFLKPSAHVGVSLIESYNVVRLPQGDFDLSLFSGRLDWNPSVNLLSSVILQSDNVDRLTSFQVIVRWLFDSATDVFGVVSRQIGAGFERPGTRVTLKVRRSFNL